MPSPEDIYAFDLRHSELESCYAGKFVLFHSGQLIGVFDDFESAGEISLKQFGDNPSLIRKVGDARLKHFSISVIRSQ